MGKGLLVSGILLAALECAPVIAQSSEAETIAELRRQVDILAKRVEELERTAGPSRAEPAVVSRASTESVSPSLSESRTVVRSPSVPIAPIDSPLQPATSAFQLSATNDSSEVALRLVTTLSKPNLGGRSTGTAAFETLSFTASAPFDKKTETGSLGTLDNFADSSVLKVRWTGFYIPISNPRVDPVSAARDKEIVQVARANCRRKAKADELASCEGDYDQTFIEKWASELADEYYALGFPSSPSFALGFESSVGYRKYKFLDAVSLAEAEAERVPFGFKAFASLFPDASLTAVTGSLEYQHAYEEQDSAVLCPASNGQSVRCVEGPVGGPTKKDAVLGALEFRKLFLLKDSWIPSIGIAPKVTYDFTDAETGIDFPIYLVPDSESNLIGGLRFGYTTKDEDLIIGVFVGSSFSFHP